MPDRQQKCNAGTSRVSVAGRISEYTGAVFKVNNLNFRALIFVCLWRQVVEVQVGTEKKWLTFCALYKSEM